MDSICKSTKLTIPVRVRARTHRYKLNGDIRLTKSIKRKEVEYWKPHKSTIEDVLLKKIRKRYYGKIGGIKIYGVDGALIRNDVDVDFSVSGEERVLLLQPDGRTLEDIKIKDIVWKKGQKVLSLNKKSISYSWKPLEEIIKHKTKEDLIEVFTRSGRSVKITKSHSCLTVDGGGNIVKIKPSEMVIGTTVLPICGNVNCIKNNIWDIRGCKSKLGQYLPNLPLCPDLGFLIGIYLAEGSANNGISISTTNNDIKNRIINYCLSIGLHKPWTNSTTVSIGNKHLTRAILRDFGTGSDVKKIPGWVFGAPLDFRKSLIDGYWSGDGSVLNDHGTIRAYAQTNSKELALGIQSLLAGIGILINFKKTHKKYPQFKNACETSYRMRVSSSFSGSLPSLTHKGKEKCRLQWKIPAWETSSIAPVPLGLIMDGNSGQGALRAKSIKGKGHCGLSFVKRNALHPRLKELVNGSILWDVVTKLIPIKKEKYTYDLCVGDNHTYVLLSGITVHNTTGGNGGRYTYVPPGEIWVEQIMTPSDFAPCIIHEFTEFSLMKELGYSYDKAHVEANKREVKFRKAIDSGKVVINSYEEMLSVLKDWFKK